VGKLAKHQKVSNHWPGEWTRCSLLQLCVLLEKMLEKTMKKNQNSYCGSNYLQLSRLYHQQLNPPHNNVLHNSMHRMFLALVISYEIQELKGASMNESSLSLVHHYNNKHQNRISRIRNQAL
jgi:hypothetical protein